MWRLHFLERTTFKIYGCGNYCKSLFANGKNCVPVAFTKRLPVFKKNSKFETPDNQIENEKKHMADNNMYDIASL